MWWSNISNWGSEVARIPWFTEATLVIACDLVYLPEHVDLLSCTVASVSCPFLICCSRRAPSLLQLLEAKLPSEMHRIELDKSHFLYVSHSACPKVQYLLLAHSDPIEE